MQLEYVNEIFEKIKEAKWLYYRLVLVVGPSGSGKTQLLQSVANKSKVPVINLNLELSKAMLDLTERQRVLKMPGILEDIIRKPSDDVILLDNTEILFDPSLKQDPLRLLQGISRNKTVVATWNGTLVDNYLTYALPNHPEYRKYPIKDFLFVNLQDES